MIKSGLLLVDKPEGPSSAHVVHRAKVSLGAKKVGHLGTLDPFASGLLLLGINEGTKISDIFLRAPKSYRGVVTLGVATDSQDCTGAVVTTRPVPPLADRELHILEQRFSGVLQQTPPMFSALKRDGVRLYKLARQGKEVPRQPRTIRIDSIQLRQINRTEISIEVTCSRGTYVRTLASDLGEALGCGAHLKSLRRIACGHLRIERAVTLDDLEQFATRAESAMISLSDALSHLRGITWDHRWLARLRLGQQECLSQIGKPLEEQELVRILDTRGNLVALIGWNEEIPGASWQLLRVFKE
ncbi:MAG TPA: tRNA pseudouridine(55) synthase TruB [Candidatus Binatia bacterium]|nr:tRNA pseudouridine(55) synthase TruB [Candidatus Binatia bacterium]